ncbi:pyocin knob domain-containing protein [Paenibacillus odorifer]|uniref:pyocin knob domain-containing protein n=1 Tax=Paenibacillus odorifer TaxID=189426 RepID=UPI00096CD7EB|nr:pyocin knob domain-containing protein [Paenibacillus odorifer]OME53801.1 hypothetical protein BSK61_16360 [Paenibacillus odorifer]
MAFNEKLPEWQEPGIEPPESKRKTGWQINDKPPAAWLNWYFNRVYKVFQEIRNKFDTHTEDNNIHVTAAKQTAWNVKETPEGAQTKADAAREAAKAASIPLAQKGAASGVAAMDATSKVPRVNTYSSLGGAGGATNLNTLYTAGTYSVTNTATGAPEANYGQVIVHVSSGDSHDNATNWIWQMFFSTIGPIYVRRKVNEKEWSAWVPSWTGYNDAPLFMTRAVVPNSTDLNTLITNGVWDIYQPSGLTNLPPAGVTYGIVFVFRASAATNYIKQELTDIITSTVYTRSRNGGTGWSAWVSTVTSDKRNVANGYAGLDANTKLLDAHIPDTISRLATRLVTDTNLNDVIGEGVYQCDSNAVAGTILNMPPAIANLAFGLRVTKTAGAVGFNQEIYCYSLAGTTSPKRYTRNYYNGTWSSWQEIETTASKGVANGYAGLDSSVRVPRNNVYNSLGGANTIPAVDLDLVLTAGVYPISPVTLNKPTASMWGQVLVFVSGAETHNNANTWTWQLLLQSSGGSYVRYKDAAAVWSTWVPWWTGNNDSPFIRDRGLIANATNFNNLVTSGLYAIYQEPPITYVNSPLVNYGILQVSRVDHNGTFYIKQEVIDVISGAIYTRGRSGTSAIWTAWVSSISSAGGNFTGPVSRTYSSESVKLSNVASYKSTQNNTGTIKITLPVGWNATMMTIKITGYEYAANRGAWELILGGYNFTNAWSMTSALADSAAGVLPFTSVRFAYDGSKCCILLGTTTNVTQYPHIEVTEVLASHVGASALASAGNWTITNLTSETGITNAVIVPIKWGNSDSVGGYSAAQVTQGTLTYAVTSGTAPTLAVTFNPAVSALTTGLRVTIKAHAATTGPVTLNVNGLGAKSIKKPNGNNPPLALGGVYTVVYDGTAFILQGEGGEYGTATAAEVLAGKTIGTENGLVNGTMPDRTRAGDSLTYTTALSAKGDGFGSLVMEPQTGYYASGLNSGGFGTLLSVDPNYVPASILSTKTVFGVQGSVPVISGVDVASGVGKWGNGDLAIYPLEGYRKGGMGAGEIKVTTAQLRSVEGDLAPANIRSGVEVFGVTGTLVERMYAEGYAGSVGGGDGIFRVSGLAFSPRIVRFTYFRASTQSTFVFFASDITMWSYTEFSGTNPYGNVVSSGAMLSPNLWGSNAFCSSLPYNPDLVNISWSAWR